MVQNGAEGYKAWQNSTPVLQQHEAALEGAPPKLLFNTHLNCWRVHGQGEQDHAGGNGPVVVVDPPWPDAAPIHLGNNHPLR